MVRKPRSRPHNTFNLVEGFSVLPDVIPATMNVAESADVTRNVNIRMIAITDVIAVIGICSNIVNRDRKSTRLNSSHVAISYAVFCLKKKKKCNAMANECDWTRSLTRRL